ncbi:MAG: hypothetical protein ABIT37_24315 [Luteolibacter sp.]
MDAGNPDGGSTRKPRRLEIWITAALILIALIIALVLTIGEGMIHRNRKPPPAATSPTVTAPPVPMEAPALAALEKYFEAPDTASKSLLVRDPARVRPLMEDYHDIRNHPYQTLGRVSPGRVTELGGTPAVLFQVEPFSGPRYPVAVVWDGQRFAVDWESLTAYGTIDWSEFTERRPTAPQTLRVFVSKAADEQKIPGLPAGTGQFEIEHRDDPQPIVVTAEATVAAQLTPLTDGLRTPVTVEMTWKPLGPGRAPVACIARLIAPGWSH